MTAPLFTPPSTVSLVTPPPAAGAVAAGVLVPLVVLAVVVIIVVIAVLLWRKHVLACERPCTLFDVLHRYVCIAYLCMYTPLFSAVHDIPTLHVHRYMHLYVGMWLTVLLCFSLRHTYVAGLGGRCHNHLILRVGLMKLMESDP